MAPTSIVHIPFLVTYPLSEYHQARRSQFVLYTEGSTDLKMLQEFARLLQKQDGECKHGTEALLKDDLYVYHFDNNRGAVMNHFKAMKEAQASLRGIVINDRLHSGEMKNVPPGLKFYEWKRNEMENYIFTHRSLCTALATDHHLTPDMAKNIVDGHVPSGPPIDSRFWLQVKGSEVLKDVYKSVCSEGVDVVSKSNYCQLIKHLSGTEIHADVKEMIERVGDCVQRKNESGVGIV